MEARADRTRLDRSYPQSVGKVQHLSVPGGDRVRNDAARLRNDARGDAEK